MSDMSEVDRFAVDHRDEYEYIRLSNGMDEKAIKFAVVAINDAMAPTIVDGNTMIFRAQQADETLEVGTVVFVRFTDGTCTVRRIVDHDDSRAELRPDNPAWRTAFVSYKAIERAAVLLEVQSTAQAKHGE